MEEKSRIPAYIAALGYALVIGFSFMFTKLALDYSNPVDMLAYRFIASFIAISLPILFKIVPVNLTRKRVIKVLPLAVVYPMLFFGFQTFGMQYATSSEAGIIMAAAPIFTMIMASYFLNEKSNMIQKISIGVSLLGVLYITFSKGASIDLANMKGMIFLLMSALSFSTYSIMARRLTRDYSTTELSFIMVTLSFIVFTGVAIIGNLRSGSIDQFIEPLKNTEFIVSILYLGVLSTLGTSMLTNFALSRLEASKMIVFSNLGTVILIGAGVIFLNESIFLYHIIGSIMIVGGVLGTNLGDS